MPEGGDGGGACRRGGECLPKGGGLPEGGMSGGSDACLWVVLVVMLV